MIRSIFIKSVKEQLRNIWILLLTVSLAPFFVFIYFLINEATQPSYHVLIVDPDPIQSGSHDLIDFIESALPENDDIPLQISSTDSREKAVKELESKSADLVFILPDTLAVQGCDSLKGLPNFEIIGDLSQTSYLISAVWLGELVDAYFVQKTGMQKPYVLTETALGSSGNIQEFDLYMPGMLVLSLIMLMFSATISFIAEVDQKTILRLKLSKMKAWHFLGGVGLVQILVGLIAILLTLLAAFSLGFQIQGSLWSFLLITVLTSASMIAFSLLLAAFTRSVTEVLIVGNFPLLLFMFFTGAAFPIKAQPWFYINGYGISWQSLMSPTHGISALHKISILGNPIGDIIPEILALLVITLVYLGLGMWAFQHRHLKTS